MKARVITVACVFVSAMRADPDIRLSVSSGVPVRLYLTKQVSKRVGALVEGKIVEPLFSFDREVVSAGSAITGKVSRVEPVGKWQRYRAIVNGDFTPLRNAWVEFDSLALPGGGSLSMQTAEVMGMNSFYTEPVRKKNQKTPPPNPGGGIAGAAKQTAKDQISGAINARSGGIAGIARGPARKEQLIDLLWSKLPYHPQYVRRGMRFDAPLLTALQFGKESLKPEDLTELGSQPGADSVVHARLVTALDSGSAMQGQVVEVVVSAPLFSAGHKLVFPEGTRLAGSVTLAKKARSFHRGGQLRFNFQNVELPEQVANLRPAGTERGPLSTQATLDAAEGAGPIKIDAEGRVQTQESKTRFIGPLIALALANKAADNDAGRHSAAGASGADANVAGRTLGGGSGFGLLGMALSQSSPYVGMAFGYYGLAWSVYSGVIAKGREVQFGKNVTMDIRFGGRARAPAGTKE